MSGTTRQAGDGEGRAPPPHPACEEAGARVEAVGLRKSFGKTVAVAEVNLGVRRGEIFGLVGPDGAGKTTTFRLLLGLLIPDAGEARIDGRPVRLHPREVRARVGYVAQQFTLYADLSIEENIRFNAEVRLLEPEAYRRRAGELLELTDLAPFSRRLAGDLSGGMKRKLALICAMIHEPEILLLDEPTTGIDPVSRRDFWRLLYGLPSRDVTLLVSTPFLDEAERCHRLGFMAGGSVLAVDTPAGLLRRMPDALLEIRTEARQEARRLLKRRPEVRRVETVGSALRVAFDPATAGTDGGRALGAWLAGQGIPVFACEPVAAGLADVFSALSESAGGAE